MTTLYERFVLSPIIDATCGMAVVTEQRCKVIGRARGVVLEIGIGSGHNLRLYDARAVTKVIGVDPNEALGDKAKRRARGLPFSVEHRPIGGENDVVEPQSVDTVVFTYTLCTVPSVPDVLAAARRALSPNGELLFCEHALAPDEAVRAWQRRIDPLWSRLFGGCRLIRDHASAISNAGFELESVEEVYAPKTPKLIGFHQIGVARVRA